jgi:hypothetical protein
MAPNDEPPLLGMRPLVRDYSFLAIGALAVCGMILYFQGPGVWGLVPVLIGLLGVLLRWGMAAGLYLVALAGWLIANALWAPPQWRLPPSPMTDLMLAAASLAYVAAQMRLQTLTRHGVPPDPRRELRPPGKRMAGRWFLPGPPTGRTATGASAGEVIVLLASIPIFALAAYLLWVRLAGKRGPDPGSLPAPLWQCIVVVWVVAILVAVGYTVLSYLERILAGPQESALYLQDQLWTATRGEQRRINRWLVWARLRRQRKEEKR